MRESTRSDRQSSVRRNVIQWFCCLCLAAAVFLCVKPAVLLVIDGYQRFISPHKGFHCAYHSLYPDAPSCSSYTRQAIDRTGIILGALLAKDRLIQCEIAYNLMKNRGLGVLVSSECSAACDNTCKQPVHSCLSGLKQMLIQVMYDLLDDIKAWIKSLAFDIRQAYNDLVYSIMALVDDTLAGIFGTKEPGSLDHIRDDLGFAYMSECAYSRTRCEPFSRKIKDKKWRQIGEEPSSLGMSVEYSAFGHIDDKIITIAFRGTELKAVDDWINDMGSAKVAELLGISLQNLCTQTPLPNCPYIPAREIAAMQKLYKERVERFAQDLAKKYGKDSIIFTGHSKGGGEALWASQATGSRAVVFNPRSEAGTGKIYDSGQARGYYLEGEILSAGRFRDSKELVKIPCYIKEAGPLARHEMKNLIISMEQYLSSAGR